MTATTYPLSVSPATPRSPLSRQWHYFRASLAMLLSDWSFLAFIIAMPVTMYLFFSGIYGDQMTEGGATVAAVMMVTMATYGGLGAAMNAGAVIQSERASGWFRQLMLTPLSASEFIVSKVLTAVCAVVPALLAVSIAGLIRGVRMPLETWLGVGGLLLAALLPMVLLGLVIGLWFPLDMMPGWMQTLGRAMPSYWAGQIGMWPILRGDFPWRGVLTIGMWVLALLALGALGYRRAVRTSRR